MSSYDDPRYYEQPGQDHTNLPNQPDSSNLPDRPSSQDTSGERPVPLPQYPAQGNDLFTRQQAVRPQPFPATPPRRGRRIFGQIIVTVALVVIAFLGGWFSHQVSTNSYYANDQSQYYARLIQQAWSDVDQNYVDRKAVNYKQMSYQAIRAMLDVLKDKGHTRFLTPEELQAERQSLSGSFTGIGIYLSQDKKTQQVMISSTIPGSPAEKAGLKRGDIIIAVNDVSTVGKDINAISQLIQGNAGAKVSLTVQRPPTNQRLTFAMIRAVIKAPNVIMRYIVEDRIAHIQIVQFADGTSAQLKDALLKAKQKGATSLILDLRDDPGGYLQEAIDTTSEFLASGNVLLEQDSSGQRTPYPVNGKPVDANIPIVVLVNNNTASAAEIVSGALQDNKRAYIIGVKTFGTGTVLREFDLEDGSAILLGTSEWLTPSGRFIRDQGITPNQVVPLNTDPLTPNDENAGNMTEQQILKSGDKQLVAAIQYLDGQKQGGTKPARNAPV